MPTPQVIDIYRFNPINSYQKIKDAGIVAVIHKASEGRTLVDNKYEERRHIFTDLGFKWGAYHFFHGNAQQEADFFLSACEPDENTVVALDWETTQGGYTPTATQARAFLERIEDRLGRKAVIYSGHAAKDKISGKDAYFGSHRLWLAQYAATWKVQASWEQPWLWQYGSEITHSTIPGLNGYTDVNTIVGQTVEQFLATWTAASAGTPPPPPPPHDHFEQEGVASWYNDNTNASGKPVNNATDMTAAHKTLPFGTKIEVARIDNGRKITVTIEDRGPYEPGRIVDLRPAAARALGLIDDGITRVRITQVS